MRNTQRLGRISRSKKRPRPTLRNGRGSRTNSNTSRQIPAPVIEADSVRAISVPDPKIGPTDPTGRSGGRVAQGRSSNATPARLGRGRWCACSKRRVTCRSQAFPMSRRELPSRFPVAQRASVQAERRIDGRDPVALRKLTCQPFAFEVIDDRDQTAFQRQVALPESERDRIAPERLRKPG